jgi:alcohol dehydrogenase (cytochrome c)
MCVTGNFQAQPAIEASVLYVSTTANNGAALDARDDRMLWTFRHKAHTEKTFGPPLNRGVAMSGGLVLKVTMV